MSSHRHQEQHEDQHQYQQAQHLRNCDSISIKLTVEKKKCHAGGHINGKICLYVPKSSSREHFSGIRLLFEGQESIQFCNRDVFAPYLGDYFREGWSGSSVGEKDEEVIRLRSRLIPGQYEYPFCFDLEAPLPCSMRCEAEDTSTCEILYCLTAYLCPTTRDGRATKNRNDLISCTVPIVISGSGHSVADTDGHSTIRSRKSFKIRSWLFKRGSIDLGLKIEKAVAAPNSTMNVVITGKNQSSAKVEEIVVRWIENVEWGVIGPERDMQTVLAEYIVPSNKLSAFRNRSSNGVDTAALRVPVKLRLVNARESYDGSLIRVNHEIHLKVKLKGRMLKNLKMSTIIKVHQPSREPTPVMAQAKALNEGEQCSIQSKTNSLPQANAIPMDATSQCEKQKFRRFKSVGMFDSMPRALVLEPAISNNDDN